MAVQYRHCAPGVSPLFVTLPMHGSKLHLHIQSISRHIVTNLFALLVPVLAHIAAPAGVRELGVCEQEGGRR